MRLSANSDDPGYGAFCRRRDGCEIKVFVNDVEIEGCITADDVEGFAERYARDLDGRLVVERRTSLGEVPTVERVVGKVRIELVERKK